MAQSLEENAKKCAQWISRSKRIAMLSGAGMSTSAGIPDFRGPNGIYAMVKMENPEPSSDCPEGLESRTPRRLLDRQNRHDRSCNFFPGI